MTKNIFRLSVLLILAAAVLTLVAPMFNLTGLLYPVRIDSVYVSQQQLKTQKFVSGGGIDSGRVFLYSPAQLRVNYIDLELTMRDSVILHGWLAIDTVHLQSPLLLIIPDLTESSIHYIPAMKEMCDRGFNVAVINLRGQGNSQGEMYNPGPLSAMDVREIIKQLKQLNFVTNVAIWGNRTGAAVAAQALADSTEADVFILQNSFISFRRYFRQYASHKWSGLVTSILPALERDYRESTGVDIDSIDMRKLVNRIQIPTLHLAANFYTRKVVEETIAVFKDSENPKKSLYINIESFQLEHGLANTKEFYDKIAAFISSSFPAKTKKSRFKKLATVD
jgi:alpha/beta superfamily hydrolase